MDANSHRKSRIGNDGPLIHGPDGRPALVCPPDWTGPPVGRFALPGVAESGPSATGMPVLFVCCEGLGQRWYRSGIYMRDLGIAPGEIDLLGSGDERDHARWNSTGGTTIPMRFPRPVVERALHERSSAFDLRTQFGIVDATLSGHVIALADEIQNDFPNGRLYAEALSLAVIGWLASNHGERSPVAVRGHQLSVAQRQRVEAYIEAEIAGNLSLEALALEAALSPFHFARLFKKTFGEPPHRYVMRRRLERAAAMLKASPERSIVDTAIECGFASQAHFSDAFRRWKGSSPSRWRLA